jgi:glutamate dehydrogenase
MTDEVGELVLADNYYQTQALSVAGRRAAELLEPEARLTRFLERAGRLNRTIEFLPSEEEIAERKAAKQGLTSPERAVLLAYSKMWLYDELLASDLPEDPFIGRVLADYFPRPLRERYSEAMQRHPLKREIVATCLTNTLLNRLGATFVHRLVEETDASPPEIVRTGTIAREVFGLQEIWRAIDELDNQVPDALQARMLTDTGQLMERATLWFVRRPGEREPIEALVPRFRATADQLGPRLANLLGANDAATLKRKQNELAQAGVPAELARRVASADLVVAVLDIAEVAAATGRSLELVATVYFALDLPLHSGWVREQVTALPAETHWQTLARTALQSDLTTLQRVLTTNVIKLSPELEAPEALIDAWQTRSRGALERYRRVLTDLQSASSVDLAMLSVAAREMRVIETV